MDAWISQNPQTIFDHVVEKLATQGHKSLRSTAGGGQCMYYDDETGRRCAAGWCMTDETLKLVHERELTSQLTAIETLWEEKFIPRPEGGSDYVIKQLQRIHDATATRTQLRGDLLTFASANGLSAAAVEAHMPEASANAGPWSANPMGPMGLVYLNKEMIDETLDQ